MLSMVLRKAIFWKNNAELIVSKRQKEILNIYIDGYDAKVTVKNWAKLADVSKDTALRDINDLVEKDVLKPTQGKVRNVSYSIVYSVKDIKSEFTYISINNNVISAVYKSKKYSDRLLESDVTRLKVEEILKEDLAYKYFSYLFV